MHLLTLLIPKILIMGVLARNVSAFQVPLQRSAVIGITKSRDFSISLLRSSRLVDVRGSTIWFDDFVTGTSNCKTIIAGNYRKPSIY
mmetsp:Transcript_6125/g.6972  ORF Transcript_6125/g.6972 Transcript_6125/m.6972 type:complete len:87 (-) Transcript_6125:1688-1948(-)